jgi:diketogulonate reductase-like aldo/keto reductase
MPWEPVELSSGSFVSIAPYFELSDEVHEGHTIPGIAFGTWRLGREECFRQVEQAISVGFIHLGNLQRYCVSCVFEDLSLAFQTVLKSTRMKRRQVVQSARVVYQDQKYLSQRSLLP